VKTIEINDTVFGKLQLVQQRMIEATHERWDVSGIIDAALSALLETEIIDKHIE